MKSYFKLSIYIPILILILNSFLITLIFYKSSNKIISNYIIIFTLTLLFFTIIIILFGEIRSKIISVNFEKNKILIKRFYGISKTIIINDKEINGFYNSNIITKNGSYNYIYLMSNHKKVAKISNQYHKNFEELAVEIKKRYKDLGYFNTGFISEIKDIFN